MYIIYVAEKMWITSLPQVSMLTKAIIILGLFIVPGVPWPFKLPTPSNTS